MLTWIFFFVPRCFWARIQRWWVYRGIDRDNAVESLIPFVHSGLIQGNPEDLYMIVYAIAKKMTYEEVEQMIVEERETHKQMLEAMQADIDKRRANGDL